MQGPSCPCPTKPNTTTEAGSAPPESDAAAAAPATTLRVNTTHVVSARKRSKAADGRTWRRGKARRQPPLTFGK